MGIIMKQGIEYTGSDKTLETALIYSTEEREVGVWTDGKPLYQKTLHISSVPSNSYAYFDIANDIEFVVDIQGTLGGQSPIHVNRPDATTAELYVTSTLNNGVIKLFVRTYRTTTAYADITCWYTKTTDTAGSGIWTTAGEYAHHYSTTEHVIGTWIDGKTLYEKCIQTIISTPTTLASDLKFGTVNISSEVSNVDMVFVDTSMSYFIDENNHKRGFLGAYAEPEKPGIAFTTYYSRTNLNAVFTIRYTKTT